MAEQTTFKQLNQINVNDHVEQKMGLSYLSWAWAHQEMKKIDDNAEITIHSFADPDVLKTLAQSGTQITPEIIEATTINYRKDKAGAYVKVSVTLNGKTETEHLPVMDYKNKAMVNPDAMSVNKAHKRCFVKALALHGLGLYIYAGEDLPEKPKAPKATNKQIDDLKQAIDQYTEVTGNTDNASKRKMEAWALGQASEDKDKPTENYEDIPKDKATQVINKLNKMIQSKQNAQKENDEQESNEQDSLFEGNIVKPKEDE